MKRGENWKGQLAQKAWREKNREKVREYGRKSAAKFRAAHGDRYRELNWAGHLKRTYGLSVEEHRKMLEQQNGRCFICGKKEELYVNHEHRSGTIRRLLCKKCNWGLGQFCDDPGLLLRAAKYLCMFDAAALGIDPASLSLAPGQSDDTCTAIKDTDLASAIIENYGIARSNAEQLDALIASIEKNASTTGAAE